MSNEIIEYTDLLKDDEINYLFESPKNSPFSMFGFEVGIGWVNLIYDLSKEIAKLDKNKECRVLQIKEKFGTLSFYTDYANPEIFSVINEYTKKSSTVCELCGENGRTRGEGYLITLCDNCEEKRNGVI